MRSVIDSMTEGDAPAGNSKSFLDHPGLISLFVMNFINCHEIFESIFLEKLFKPGMSIGRDYPRTRVLRATTSGQFRDNLSRSHRCVSHQDPSPEPWFQSSWSTKFQTKSFNPQAPVAPIIADDVVFGRFQGEGVEFF